MGMYLPSHACFQCMIKAICLSNGFGEFAKRKYLSIAETNIFLLVKINRTRQVSYTVNNFDVLVGRLCIDLFCLWFICNAIKDVKNSWANKVDSSVCADQFEALTYPPPAGNPSGKLPGKPPGIWTFEDYFDQILAPGEAFYILTKL